MPVTPPGDRAESEMLESFNTRLPRGLHRRLKVHTAREGLKIQAVVARALEQYLQQIERKKIRKKADLSFDDKVMDTSARSWETVTVKRASGYS